MKASLSARDQLDLRPGDHVADVGSGRGALTLPLAEAVGPDGRVDAVDQSGEMVRLLTDTVADLPQVNVVQADATELPDGPYDVVAASLVLFFLPDPVAVLRAWRDALRPGGWVGITKDVLTDVVDAGRDAKIVGLPRDAAHVAKLMCPTFVVLP